MLHGIGKFHNIGYEYTKDSIEKFKMSKYVTPSLFDTFEHFVVKRQFSSNYIKRYYVNFRFDFCYHQAF